jgi:hypothetical protein
VPGQASKANGGDGYMQGVEFSTRWQIDRHWSVFGHIAWVEGEADQFIGLTTQTRREPLGKIAPLVGYGGVRWQTTDGRVWTELVCLTYGEAARMNNADQADTQRIPPTARRPSASSPCAAAARSRKPHPHRLARQPAGPDLPLPRLRLQRTGLRGHAGRHGEVLELRIDALQGSACRENCGL